MSESGPMTVTRNFNPTIYGYQKNQQNLAIILAVLLMPTFMIGTFLVGPNAAVNIAIGQAVIETLFFVYVASSASNLYHFECWCRFLKSINKGEDYIEKHGVNGLKKARNLSHIKKVHDGKYIEYFFTKERPHNWGIMLKLKSFMPEDFDIFAENVERMFIGNPDRTLIKTFLHVRSDLTDYAKPIREELYQNRIPQIVRDSMFEFQMMCEEADSKTAENYMLILIDYTANPIKAKGKLEILLSGVQDILDDMEIGCEVMDTEEKILGMFYGHITYEVLGEAA